MDFAYDQQTLELRAQLEAFFDRHIYPNEPVFEEQILASLKIFDQIYLMTYGGPNFATRPIIQYIYESGFTNYRIGYASAISYVFFALIVLVSIAQFKLFARRPEEG